MIVFTPLVPVSPSAVTFGDAVNEDKKLAWARKWLGYLAVGASAYHGYKRSKSPAIAAAWAGVALFFPITTLAVAVTQGFGREKGKGESW